MANSDERDSSPSATVQGVGVSGLAVVLGVEKPLGRVLVDGPLLDSERVRGVYFERPKGGSDLPEGVEGILADPSGVFNITEACKGASIVYDCYEPNYLLWKKAWAPVTSNVALASIEVSAPLVFASHLINSESENERQEAEVLKANKSNLIKTVVVRVPQLIGRRVINPLWKLVYGSVLEGKKAHWIGDPNVSRTMLDVDDAAEAMVQLGRNSGTFGRAVSVASPETISGREFIELAFKAVGRKPEVGSWGRGIVMTGGFLASDARDVLKMPYDYYSPFLSGWQGVC